MTCDSSKHLLFIGDRRNAVLSKPRAVRKQVHCMHVQYSTKYLDRLNCLHMTCAGTSWCDSPQPGPVSHPSCLSCVTFCLADILNIQLSQYLEEKLQKMLSPVEGRQQQFLQCHIATWVLHHCRSPLRSAQMLCELHCQGMLCSAILHALASHLSEHSDRLAHVTLCMHNCLTSSSNGA